MNASEIPTVEIKGRKYITVDGIRLLRKALGLSDLKKPMEFFGDFQGFMAYMREARKETFRACHPDMLTEYEQD